MRRKVILGTDAFADIIKKMYQRGEISLENYARCLRRKAQIPLEMRKNRVVEYD